MRCIQKFLLDYDNLQDVILTSAAMGDVELSLMLVQAKADIERIYDKQCSNYAVMISVLENGAQSYSVVSRECSL